MHSEYIMFMFSLLLAAYCALVSIARHSLLTLLFPVRAARSSGFIRFSVPNPNTFSSTFIRAICAFQCSPCLKGYSAVTTNALLSASSFFAAWMHRIGTFAGTVSLVMLSRMKNSVTSRACPIAQLSHSDMRTSLRTKLSIGASKIIKQLETDGAGFHSILVNAISYDDCSQGGTSAASSGATLDYAQSIARKAERCHLRF